MRVTWHVAQKYAYPLTALYLGAVAILMAVANEDVTIGTGVVSLLALAVLAGFIATWRELRGGLRTVDGRLTEALARIDRLLDRNDELIGALDRAGVKVPSGSTGEAPAERERNTNV